MDGRFERLIEWFMNDEITRLELIELREMIDRAVKSDDYRCLDAAPSRVLWNWLLPTTCDISKFDECRYRVMARDLDPYACVKAYIYDSEKTKEVVYYQDQSLFEWIVKVGHYNDLDKTEKADVEMARAYIRTFGGKKLTFVPWTCRKDRELALTSVRSNGYAYFCLCSALRRDPEIILETVKQSESVYLNMKREWLDSALENAELVIRLNHLNDRDRAEKLLIDVPWMCREMPLWAISRDCSLVKILVRYEPKSLRELPAFQDDKAVVKEAIKAGGTEALKNAAECLQEMPQMQKMAKTCDRKLFFEHIESADQETIVPDEIWKNRTYAKRALRRNSLVLCNAPEYIKDDAELVAIAVKGYGGSLEYASERLRDTKDIVRLALKDSGEYLTYASERLKKDAELYHLSKNR